MRKEINDNKGITIIGLVVTIIVLLILAGVTIVALTGQHSIIKEANDAKNATNKAAAQEEIELATVQALKAGDFSVDSIKTHITNKLKGAKIVSTGDDSVIVSYKGYEFAVNTDGDVVENTLLAKIDASNYGDFINYGIDLENGARQWKIFYSNSEGTYIIAANYIRNNNSTLSSALSKANMRAVNGYDYSVYWQDIDLTKKDSDGNAIIDSNASKFMYNWTGGGMFQKNKIAIASLLDTNAWNDFLTDGATMAIGGPTIEMFRASWNEKTYSSGTHTKIQISQDTHGYGYYLGASNDNSATVTGEYLNMSSDVGSGDELYFPSISSNNNCNGYWLASPSACNSKSYVMMANKGGAISYAENTNVFLGVRPVVFLPSNIKASKDASGVWQIEK